MKGYEDIVATLMLLAAVISSGFTYLEWKTKQIENDLKQYPVEAVKKGLKTEAEKTIFERASKRTE